MKNNIACSLVFELKGRKWRRNLLCFHVWVINEKKRSQMDQTNIVHFLRYQPSLGVKQNVGFVGIFSHFPSHSKSILPSRCSEEIFVLIQCRSFSIKPFQIMSCGIKCFLSFALCDYDFQLYHMSYVFYLIKTQKQLVSKPKDIIFSSEPQWIYVFCEKNALVLPQSMGIWASI